MHHLNWKNHQSEESFHDEWAKITRVEDIDVVAQFEGETSPEYREAVSLLGIIRGKKILNIGCGLGEEVVYLALKGANVVAIDISTEMLKFTKKLAKKYGVSKKVVYRHMSAEKLEFGSETFDLCFGCNILHHVNIDKAIKEIWRVLKPGGSAVFSEPLGYNSVINIYRVMACKVRTDHEHPLRFEDLNKIKNIFSNFDHREFQLFTLLIFIWFFLGERLHPNKVRYWKKIISESEKYGKVFTILYKIDRIVLKYIPYLKKYCWITIIKVQK